MTTMVVSNNTEINSGVTRARVDFNFTTDILQSIVNFIICE